MSSQNSNNQKAVSQTTFDPEILNEFQIESKSLVDQMTTILEDCEGNFSQVKSLEQYGQTVDRIMGGAKSLAIGVADTNSFIHKIGDYAALCKAVGYKASQIKNNEQFYDIAVAFLLDATEMLADLIEMLGGSHTSDFKSLFTDTFLERLKWISGQFGAEYRASVDIDKGKSQKMSQDEIDNLLKKLGLD